LHLECLELEFAISRPVNVGDRETSCITLTGANNLIDDCFTELMIIRNNLEPALPFRVRDLGVDLRITIHRLQGNFACL
jgi:hypothetical protein